MTSDKYELRQRKMSETPVPKLIMTLAVPTVIAMLVSSLYNLADTYFVGQISTSATAAVGVIFPLMAIIQAFGMMFAMGAASYISRLIGMKDNEKANETFSTAFFMCLVVGILLAIVGLSFSNEITWLLGATTTNFEHASAYAEIIYFGTPFIMCSFVVNNSLRSEGSAMLGMIGMTVGVVLNVILDPIFIFAMNFGVKGAAIATVISQAVGFVVLVLLTMTSKCGLTLSIKKFRFDFSMWWEIVRIGCSALFRQGLAAVSAVVLNLVATKYGDYVIATTSIVSKVSWLCFSVILGISQGYQPVVGFCHGAKKYKKLWDSLWFTLAFTTIVGIIEMLILLLFAKPIISGMRNDIDVINLGVRMLKIYSIRLIFAGILLTYNMTTQGMGKAMATLVVSLLMQGLIYIPTLVILEKQFAINGIVFAQLVADAISIAVVIILAFFTVRNIKRLKNKELQAQAVCEEVNI